jgi:DNA-binding IclR family transcriptional regulator
MPIHCAAPCKAILAYLPTSERAIIIKNAPFKRYNENTITSRRAYAISQRMGHQALTS